MSFSLLQLQNLILIPPSAVKFIRDQHREQVGFDDSVDDHSPAKGSTNVAQAAFKSIRKTLGGGPETQVITNVLEDDLDEAPPPVLDPLDGWCQGVSLKRSHFCVLLKPQIVLQSETNKESVCVVAAGVAKLQTNIIMDDSNADDPVSGKIMSRQVNLSLCFYFILLLLVIGHILRFMGCKPSLPQQPVYLKMAVSLSKFLLISDANRATSSD